MKYFGSCVSRWTCFALVLVFAVAARGDENIPQLRVNDPSLRDYLGKEVVISGRVSRTGKSSSGHNFLNFDDNREFSVVCFQEDVAQFRDGVPADVYRRRFVAIRGRLESFRGKLQIRLTKPTQISVVEPASFVTQLRLKPVTLKLRGPDNWVSPGELVFAGKDPEGRTRREHVLRHAKDQPDRQGPHGVFDGGEEYVFALLDKAWEFRAKRGVRKEVDGARTSYTIPMGCRVGYLGGTTGRSKGNPPLFRIFIVVRTGTSEVITAFPK